MIHVLEAKSTFQGEEGDSLELELSIMFQSSFPTQWGTGHLTTLKDENANVYVIWREFWDNENDEPMTKGTKIKGTFKVKGHNHFTIREEEVFGVVPVDNNNNYTIYVLMVLPRNKLKY